MPGREPFVTLTNAEVWAEIRKHEETTGDGGHADHEARIRSLEWRYYALLAGLLGGIIGAAGISLRGL